MGEVSPARRAAFQILMTVERGHAHSDELLRSDAVSALAGPDRNLTTALVLGVLRWQILLDEQLRQFIARPNAKLDAEVKIALRLGAFQLLFLDRVPARAAIDESVELTRQAGHRFASGMVNAVLRKLARAAQEQGALRSVTGHEPGGRARSRSQTAGVLAPEAGLSSAASAHPAWMVERWSRFFGDQAACAICLHDQNAPALAIRLSAPEVENHLVDAGITLAPGALLSAARTVTAGDVTATGAFHAGQVRIQDEGSQLVAEVAAALRPKPERILDCCAAPGGKTLILAERNPGGRIIACEASTPRLESLCARLSPFGDRVRCRLADATTLGFASEFDLVLADVPCSGTGTLARNPEIRHRLRAEDLTRQAERQRAILSSALRAVRPGGRVVYSTCSLEPEENEQVIAAVLAEAGDVRLSSITERIDDMTANRILTEHGTEGLRNCITREGFLRLLPGAFGTDGFFIAVIEKKS